MSHESDFSDYFRSLSEGVPFVVSRYCIHHGKKSSNCTKDLGKIPKVGLLESVSYPRILPPRDPGVDRGPYKTIEFTFQKFYKFGCKF